MSRKPRAKKDLAHLRAAVRQFLIALDDWPKDGCSVEDWQSFRLRLNRLQGALERLSGYKREAKP